MRRVLTAMGALVAGAALAVGPAAPAHAHASLVSSAPAASSVLDDPPDDIVLDFDEPVTAEAGGIRLLDSSGSEIVLGSPEQGQDSTLLVTPVPDVDDGAYVVAWRVMSQDGHPATGAFTFQIGRDAAVDTRALLASVLSGQDGDPTVDQLATFNRLLTYVGLALAVGGAFFVVWVWPGAAARWSARRVIWCGWGLVLVGAIGTVVVSGPYLTGRSIKAAVDLDVLREVTDARVFQMATLRLVLVVLAVPLLLRLGRGLSANAQLAGVLLGELVLGTVALGGHSASGKWAGAGVALDAVHLGAMTLWLGGLALLVLMLATDRRLEPEPGEPSSASPDETGELAPVGASVGAAVVVPDERTVAVERFSGLAFGCVVALVVTGVGQGWRILPGGLTDLVDTGYGRTLLVKLVFVAGLVGLGWWSRRLVRRRVLGQPLWRSVATEVVVATAVLAVTAVLTGQSPNATASAPRTTSATMIVGDLLADVSVSPAGVGPNDLHLTFSPPGGTLDAVKAATARITLPGRSDLGAIPVELLPAGPNHFIASGLQIPYEGDWTLDVVATRSDDSTALLTTTLDVAG